MNNPVWIDDKGKIVEPEYCRDFLSRHPMRCINDRFYTVDGPLPDESKLKRTIYEEISPWLHAKGCTDGGTDNQGVEVGGIRRPFAPAM